MTHQITTNVAKRIRASEIILLEECLVNESEIEKVDKSSSDHQESREKPFRRKVTHDTSAANKENLDQSIQKSHINQEEQSSQLNNQDPSQPNPQSQPQNHSEKPPENLYEGISRVNNADIAKIEEKILSNLDREKPKPKNTFTIRKLRQQQKPVEEPSAIQKENPLPSHRSASQQNDPLEDSVENHNQNITHRIDSVESQRESQKETEGEIKSLVLPESQLESLVKEMMDKTEEIVLKTFGVKEGEFAKELIGEPVVNFLGMKRLGKPILFVVKPDQQFLAYRRLIICGVLGVETSDLPFVLTSLLDFIWSKDPVVDIRVNLIHTEDADGKLGVSKKIQDSFTNVGFKWKLMVSDDNGERVSILGLRRGEDAPEIEVSELEKEPLVIRAGISLKEGDQFKQSPSPISDLLLLKTSLLELQDQSALTNLSSAETEILEGLKNSSLSGVRNAKIESKDKLEEFLTENQFPELSSAINDFPVFPLKSLISVFSLSHLFVLPMGELCLDFIYGQKVLSAQI